MKIAGRKKLLIAVLGVGAFALLADRLAQGSGDAPEPPESYLPADRSAGSSVGRTGAAFAAPAAATAGDRGLAQRIRLAAAAVPKSGPVRDLFHVPADWSGANASQLPAYIPAAKPRFDQAHKLHGIILDGDRSSAMVNGTLVKLGQTVDGHRLIRLSSGRAVFESEDGQVVLETEEHPRGGVVVKN